ncbi:septum site-determining protein Ssd [Prescottella subtropica]|uniref:septum site-determining protein Ssd n=1 Tax=Prescottella subtropica TaxID=2545757 RepID=UPI0010F735A3|nr:septum site-determining protein Ssd [Prescottella subtropica]
MAIDHIDLPGRIGVLGVVSTPGVAACLRSIAAATDQTFVEASHPVGRADWMSADLVVVDADSARRCAELLPRRDRVVLVCAGTPTLDDWRTATVIGADRVLGIPDDEPALVAAFGEHRVGTVADGAVVAVVGGCGGAGASTLAAAVALASARRQRDGHTPAWTLLVDVDPFGGGLDLLLGIEGRPGLRWPGLAVEGGRVAADALRAALPAHPGGLGVLACGRGRGDSVGPTPVAVSAVVDAGRSTGAVVVCDVPRHPSAAGDRVLDDADLVVVVVPATVRGGLAAECVLARIADRNLNRGIVIRGPAPGGLRGRDLAESLGVPLLASVRPEPRIASMLERGGLDLGRRSPLAAGAGAVLDVLSSRPRRGRAAA